MQAARPLTFGAYRLDPQTGQVWRGKQAVKLTPKATAVLRYVVARAGQVVTKAELFAAVWPETVVSDAALTSCIQELRQALRDNAKSPRYLETVHRRGFQFIGKMSRPPSASSEQQEDNAVPLVTLTTEHSPQPIVGRESELVQLHSWFNRALRGERQVVFVTGEPGIGKTSVVEAFLQRLESRVPRLASEQVQRPRARGQGSVFAPTPSTQHPAPSSWIGRGQCIEHYGTGEPYLPVLEALGRLCRESEGQQLIKLLSQHAPTWLVQMPALLSAAELEALQRKTAGATRERMLRELAEAVEVLTAERGLVLWFEDLHWSDVSTLDWLAFLARRREPARLLILGTYRPVEVIVSQHPLKTVKQELQLHGQCMELPLGFLRKDDVEAYLARRFTGGAIHESPLRRLAHLIHRRTDGNPLFMVNVADYLAARGVIVQIDGRWEVRDEVAAVEAGVPASLQQLIEQQLGRLSVKDQRLLEVASVAGVEFSAAAVAAGLATDGEEVEERCTELVRRELFLRASGTAEWLDGTVATRYGFLHALYQEVLYGRIPVGRRQRLHQRIGEREEAAYGERAKEIAAELALHFERGRDYRKAIQYLQQAGENAVRRSANQEAITLLTKGLELLKTLPDTPECAQQELGLQITLGPALIATKGWAAPEVERAYTRAQELCQQLGETPQLFTVLAVLRACYSRRAETQPALQLGEHLLQMAQNVQDPDLLLEAHSALGVPLFTRGEFVLARVHFEQSFAFYESQQHRSHAFLYGQDPGVICLYYTAWTLWLLGYPDQALKKSHNLLTLAQELSHPLSLALACFGAARVHQFHREEQAVREQTEAVVRLSTEQGLSYSLAVGTLLHGWALVGQGQEEEGIEQMHQGQTAWEATRTEGGRPYNLALLAEAYGKVGQIETGLSVLTEALDFVGKTGERWYEAELYRLYGELSLRNGEAETGRTGDKNSLPDSPIPRFSVSSPEDSFLKAIEIARKQQARSLELRAVVSLARLWQRQGKKKQARKMLAEIYNWFTEGFDTKDLQEAKALLKELS